MKLKLSARWEDTMKIALFVAGVVLALIGLHWISEGTGILAYPQSPTMYLKPMWTYIGVGTLIIGLVGIWYSQR
jgi:H+/Cl- antiporter ClcA